MSDTSPESSERHGIFGSTSRLEAFSDGVLAIILTIMAFEIAAPEGGALRDLRDRLGTFLAYALSFAFIAIYWNNHHHTFRVCKRMSNSVMWSNMFLLFCLSLIPAATEWVGTHPGDPGPAAFYGMVGTLAGMAYYVLLHSIIRANPGTGIAESVGNDAKGKLSVVLYLVGVGCAYIHPAISYALYACVSIIWWIPDKRMVRAVGD